MLTENWFAVGYACKDYTIPKNKIGLYNAKECSHYHTIALISHASKGMLKSFKLGFNIT